MRLVALAWTNIAPIEERLMAAGGVRLRMRGPAVIVACGGSRRLTARRVAAFAGLSAAVPK